MTSTARSGRTASSSAKPSTTSIPRLSASMTDALGTNQRVVLLRRIRGCLSSHERRQRRETAMPAASAQRQLKARNRERGRMVEDTRQRPRPTRAATPAVGVSSEPGAAGEPRPRLAHPELMVQHGVELAVEGGAERSAIHHGKVGGVDPVLLQPELLADGAMELRAG